MTYSYDPANITARGKDQMRFELGDTQTDGGAKTCALADEEYEALLKGLKEGRKAWMRAKLAVLEAILFKLSYQVNTKISVLQYDFGDRAANWQKLYDTLKKQVLPLSRHRHHPSPQRPLTFTKGWRRIREPCTARTLLRFLSAK